MQHERAEAAASAFFDRDQHFVFFCKAQDQLFVQRFGEARVGDRGRQSHGGELICRLQALLQTRAKREQCNLVALAHNAALADFQRFGIFGNVDADAFTTRIAEGGGAVVDHGGGRDHARQFRFIGGGHHHHVRQRAQIADVERAGMRGAVGADQSGAVDGEAHRQLLQRHVMRHLIIAALQEG